MGGMPVGFLPSGEVNIPLESAYDRMVHLNMEDTAVDNIASLSVIKVFH